MGTNYFANCQTTRIVYLLLCKCGSFYVGKTKQELWQRIQKHMYSMQIGNFYLPVGRHVVDEHKYRVPKVKVTAPDQLHILIRGGDWKKRYYNSNRNRFFSSFPPGLNEYGPAALQSMRLALSPCCCHRSPPLLPGWLGGSHRYADLFCHNNLLGGFRCLNNASAIPLRRWLLPSPKVA